MVAVSVTQVPTAAQISRTDLFYDHPLRRNFEKNLIECSPTRAPLTELTHNATNEVPIASGLPGIHLAQINQSKAIAKANPVTTAKTRARVIIIQRIRR